MTSNPEALGSTEQYIHGDEALRLFNKEYRHDPDVNERFMVEDIGVEFPWLETSLGDAAVHWARAGENNARAFKIRGAAVGAEALLNKGYGALQTASAGNMGRSVALIGKKHNIPTRIAVPRSAPEPKKEGIRRLWPGGLLEVREVGSTFDETLAWTLAHADGYGFLAPFDDPNVIAGQGTLVDDIIEQIDDFDHIVVPVGGGGLIAGIAKRIGELGMHALVHGVEAEGSNSLSLSMAASEITAADRPNKKYGGSAVKHVGKYALDICLANKEVIRLHTVPDSEVNQFMEAYWQHRQENQLEGHVANFEPTSLVPVLTLQAIAKAHPGEVVVGVGTAHNDILPQAAGASKRSSLDVMSGTFAR
ncbi:MAG TPA: pyridoxal-phosphate dependent enzyme [Candidatus Saccharimonadales bacterium]|nr:pyridoxal-phosphate dependent enzyme [Candidatus Saccharimonadales bacterium]